MREYYDGLQTILAGKPERIYTEYRDSNKNLVDPTSPKVEIYDFDGNLFVSSSTPIKESTGLYYYIVTISTATPVKEGMYSAYWWGTIGSGLVSMDVPQYFWVQSVPWKPSQSSEFAQSVRRFIGDTNPNNYRILNQDLYYFISDAVKEVESLFPMGYSVTVSATGITFNKTLTNTPEFLFRIKTAELIIANILNDVLFSSGNLTLGDIKINMTDIIKARKEYLKDLQDRFNTLIRQLKMQYNYQSAGIIDTYLADNSDVYNLTYYYGES